MICYRALFTVVVSSERQIVHRYYDTMQVHMAILTVGMCVFHVYLILRPTLHFHKLAFRSLEMFAT